MNHLLSQVPVIVPTEVGNNVLGILGIIAAIVLTLVGISVLLANRQNGDLSGSAKIVGCVILAFVIFSMAGSQAATTEIGGAILDSVVRFLTRSA